MNRLVFVSAAALLFCLAPVSDFAAPTAQRPVASANPSLVLVDGWWEQESRNPDARDRYWRLPPGQRQRYDKLQAEQSRRAELRRRYDDDDRRAVQQQHLILGFQVQVR